MPTYKVIAPGFHSGEYYHPEGKRQTLTVDKPFTKKKGKNPLPSWLTEMPKESEAVRKKRESQKASEQKSTQKQVAEASTEGDGDEASFISKATDKLVPDSVVETL